MDKLHRWSCTEYELERIVSTVDSVVERFGGAWLLVPRISTALTPAVVVLAIVLVLVNRPLPHQRAWAEGLADDLSQILASTDTSRIVTVAVLLLGVLLVAPRTPLVDRIRARNEAFKDADRLLRELTGPLIDLSHALYTWREHQESDRFRRLDDWVEIVSEGRYGWRVDGGLDVRDEPYRGGWEGIQPADDDEAIETALQRVIEVDVRIHDAGLERVAQQLTGRVGPSIREIGLFRRWQGSSGVSKHTVCSPQVLTKRLEAVSAGMFLWRSVDQPVAASVYPTYGDDDEGSISSRSREPSAVERTRRAEAELETHAFKCAEFLDRQLAETMVLELHVRRLIGFLRRRTSGSRLAQALSAIQK